MGLCLNRHPSPLSRRDMLKGSGIGFGSLALNAMLTTESSSTQLSPSLAKAKRVIFLFMHGGPSTLDLFDPKESLKKNNGKPLPYDKPRIASSKTGNLLASPWDFKQYGQSGAWVSELLPNISSISDDLCFLNSMHCLSIDIFSFLMLCIDEF